METLDGPLYRLPMISPTRPFGDLLRDWRSRRRLSQLDLACEADISTRHLSFLETGRSQPSREMVLHLGDRLDLSLRDRNALLAAAGYAPVYPERPLADPALSAARKAVELVLKAHEPYPALALDRHWTLVASNEAVPPLLVGVLDPSLLEPPVNVLRLSLHPAGLAPLIVNLADWRSHLLERLRRQIDISGDAILIDLMRELRGYPAPERLAASPAPESVYDGVVVPFQLSTPSGTLSFLSTTTIFGTPIDVTLSELALESFFPADPATAEALRHSAEG